MNIALIAHDNKKELMAQFCTAYCGILAQHTLCATATTGQHRLRRHGADHPPLPVLLPTAAASRSLPASPTTRSIWCCASTIPATRPPTRTSPTSIRLCDQNNIPYASNLASAEMLVLGLARGDLDWRNIVNPKTKPFTA